MKRRAILGGGVAWLAGTALRASAQEKVRKLGMLVLGHIGPLDDAFFGGLAQRGWSMQRNLRVDKRVTAREQERAPLVAKEVLDAGAEILVTVGTSNATAARSATSSVPIVMLASGFPREAGLVASLARPGGNVTGLSIYSGRELFGKYIELLRELVPSLRELGVFWGYAPPAFPEIETEIAVGEMRSAAKALGINFRVWFNRSNQELEASLAAAGAARLDALFVSAGGPQSVPEGIERISTFCAQRRLPTMCDVAGLFFASGGLLSYSVDFGELGARGASFVDRILRGARPGELPIEHPTRFELVVNAKRARAIGAKIPQSLLARADRVIE